MQGRRRRRIIEPGIIPYFSRLRIACLCLCTGRSETKTKKAPKLCEGATTYKEKRTPHCGKQSKRMKIIIFMRTQRWPSTTDAMCAGGKKSAALCSQRTLSPTWRHGLAHAQPNGESTTRAVPHSPTTWPESTLLATSSLRIRSVLTPTACLLRHGGLVALPWEMPHGIRVDVSRYPLMGENLGDFRIH